MRYEWLVGTRYLRARVRNGFISFIALISMLGIALGVAVLIVVLSVVNGFERALQEKILAMTAHATIAGYEGPLRNWPAVREAALATPGVTGAAPYVEAQGLAVAGDSLSGVVIRGIDPALEAGVSGIPGLMTAGRLATLESGAYRIVLGSDLAEALGVGVGDRVILMIAEGTVTPAGLMPRMRRFEVSGIFRAGMYEYDRTTALIHLADAARLYRLGDRVGGVRLAVDDVFEAGRLVRDVAIGIGGGVYVDDWTRRHANFFRSIELTKTILFVILLLVVAVAAFNIVSTLVMVVRDKRGDIAILRTMGAAPRSIHGIFMIQGSLIGAAGTLAGGFAGVLLALNLERLVGWLEDLTGFQVLAPDVYFISDLPSHVDWGDVWRIALTALVLALVSTLYPAWRAARVQPAEALRHE